MIKQQTLGSLPKTSFRLAGFAFIRNNFGGCMVKKYKVICKNCGIEREITYKNPRDLCVKCAANARKNCLTKEDFIVRDGRKRRAKLFKCPECKEEKLVRIDHLNKTGLCQKCSAAKLVTAMGSKQGKEHPTYVNGIATYRKETFKTKEKKCEICGLIEGYIIIHHIDGNRKNNDPDNHLVLCNSCHGLLHYRLRKGLTNDAAIAEIKEKNIKPN